eukprot:13730109-Alexandrium_andersonii.AAC.1
MAKRPCPTLGICEVGDPFSCNSGHRNLGVADFHRFRAGDPDVSPFGSAGGRRPFHMEYRPRSQC